MNEEYYNTFNTDCNNGRRNELRLCKILQKYQNTDVRMVNRYDKEQRHLWDITFLNPQKERGFMEVKVDDKFLTTSNIAIEVSQKGEWSGIVTTKSHWWCEKLNGKYYCLPTNQLYDYIINNWEDLRKTTCTSYDRTTTIVLLPGEQFFALNPMVFEDQEVENIPDAELDDELLEFDEKCLEQMELKEIEDEFKNYKCPKTI